MMKWHGETFPHYRSSVWEIRKSGWFSTISFGIAELRGWFWYQKNVLQSNFQYKLHPSRQYNCWSLRCSWSITCWWCSNFIFILDLTPGFNGLGKDKCKMRQETYNFGDLVWLILDFHSIIVRSSHKASKTQNWVLNAHIALKIWQVKRAAKSHANRKTLNPDLAPSKVCDISWWEI